jgi:hypothetical protein
MICSNCGTTNPSEARFCMKCGTALPAARATPPEADMREQAVRTALRALGVRWRDSRRALQEDWQTYVQADGERLLQSTRVVDGTTIHLIMPSWDAQMRFEERLVAQFVMFLRLEKIKMSEADFRQVAFRIGPSAMRRAMDEADLVARNLRGR